MKSSRRSFLKTASASAAAIGAPTIIPSSALGKDGAVAPSERITMGVVGWGMMGPGNTRNFLGMKDCQVVAACDVDKHHLKDATETINAKYGDSGCAAFADYRELMARDDIDAVMLALPDHWHMLTAVEAAKNNKHIYGEKPLARTVAEQQAIVKAVGESGKTWQTGSWQRSVDNFHTGAEIAINELVGKITHVEVGLPSGHHDFAGTKDEISPTAPPEHLDFEAWTGPAELLPYIPARIHKNWRWHLNTGGGQLLDWIGHHCDIAHWGLGYDLTGPTDITATGEIPDPGAVWNAPTKFRVETKYSTGVTMTIGGGQQGIAGGCKWIGTDGWIHVDRGRIDCSNKELLAKGGLPDDLRKTKLFKSPGHHQNFIDCIRSGEKTITPVEVAHHSAVPGHLGMIALMTGRALKWDPVKEVILGDEGASAMLTRTYRAPYKMA